MKAIAVIRGRQAPFDELPRRRNRLRIERRSARLSTAFPGHSGAVTGALGDEPSLEVRDGAEDVEHELAGSRGGVEALLEADQVNAASLEIVDGLKKLAQRAPQTVEARAAHPVAGTGRCGGINIGRFRDRLGGHVGDAVYPR